MIYGESWVRKAGIYGGLGLSTLSGLLVVEDHTPDLHLMPWGRAGLTVGLVISVLSLLLPRRNRPWR